MLDYTVHIKESVWKHDERALRWIINGKLFAIAGDELVVDEKTSGLVIIEPVGQRNLRRGSHFI
jgi:hypothetical protein